MHCPVRLNDREVRPLGYEKDLIRIYWPGPLHWLIAETVKQPRRRHGPHVRSRWLAFGFAVPRCAGWIFPNS